VERKSETYDRLTILRFFCGGGTAAGPCEAEVGNSLTGEVCLLTMFSLVLALLLRAFGAVLFDLVAALGPALETILIDEESNKGISI